MYPEIAAAHPHGRHTAEAAVSGEASDLHPMTAVMPPSVFVMLAFMLRALTPSLLCAAIPEGSHRVAPAFFSDCAPHSTRSALVFDPSYHLLRTHILSNISVLLQGLAMVDDPPAGARLYWFPCLDQPPAPSGALAK